jgi:tetratricopeptide (TPR) repeat protein
MHLNGCDSCQQLASVLAPGLATASAEPGSDDAGPALDNANERRYRLRDVLAVGGMGTICRAYDNVLHRLVAIKTPRDETTSRKRFAREVQILSQLNHPAIVPVLDAGKQSDDSPYFVMPLLEGETLDRRLDKTSTTADRLALLALILPIADAVAHAHAQRVLHRDIKPHNIMITQWGDAVLLDWGLAKQFDADDDIEGSNIDSKLTPDSHLTRLGQGLGTVDYSAPEQLAGAPVDQRSDVFALGAVMFTILAGVSPRHCADHQRALAVVSPDLAAIVRRAIAPTPNERYPSAHAMTLDLDRFQRGLLVGARHYSLRQRAARWIRHHRIAVGAVAIAVTVATVSGVLWSRAVEAQRQRKLQADAVALANGERRQRAMELLLGDVQRQYATMGRSDLLVTLADKIDGLVGKDARADLDTARLRWIQSEAALIQKHLDVAAQTLDLADSEIAHFTAAQQNEAYCPQAIARAQLNMQRGQLEQVSAPLLPCLFGTNPWGVHAPRQLRIQALTLVADVDRQTGNVPRAIALFQFAFDQAKAASDVPRFDYFAIGNRLTSALISTGNISDAKSLAQELYRESQRAMAAAPADRALRTVMVLAQLSLAKCEIQLRSTEATAVALAALAAARHAVNDDPNDVDRRALLGTALNLAGRVASDAQRQPLLEESTANSAAIAVVSPSLNNLLRYRIDLSDLAAHYLEQGNTTKAWQHCQTGLALIADITAKHPQANIATEQMNMLLVAAEVQSAMHQTDEELRLIDQALAVAAKAQTGSAPFAALRLTALAMRYALRPREIDQAQWRAAIEQCRTEADCDEADLQLAQRLAPATPR